MNISDILRHSTKLYGDKIAIDSPDGQITYCQFEEDCWRLGHVFFQLGLAHGDRVAILDLNSLFYCYIHFALPSCGLVVVPLNYRLAASELIGILTDAKVSALIYSPTFKDVVEKMRPELPFLRHFICTRSIGDGHELPTLMEQTRPVSKLPEPHDTDVSHLLYTSGTTGKPKGVMLSHLNNAAAITSLLVEFGLNAEDVGLMVVPMFHVAGCHVFIALIACGATIHILPGFDPAETLNAIQTKRVSFCFLVPAMITALLDELGQGKKDMSSIRTIAYGGAPMPEELLKAATNRFGNIFSQLYGLTEAGIFTCLKRDDHKNPRYLGSAGREVFGIQVMVVDENGRELGNGQIGEIIGRGASVTKGYWNAPDETALALKEGWFHTGDLGVRDENNYIFLKDRKKDMIVSGGENIYPIEVENVLHGIPAIQEAAVIGVPDPKWGEKVLALVNLKPNTEISPEEILSFCRERLAGFKCPKSIEFKGPLPRTSSGKIQKNELRKPYWKGRDRAIH